MFWLPQDERGRGADEVEGLTAVRWWARPAPARRRGFRRTGPGHESGSPGAQAGRAPGVSSVPPNARSRRARQPSGDAARSGVVFWLGRDQRGHRWPFVGEHPDIALRADQRECRARDIQRVRLLTRGRKRQYLQCLDLDDAASVLRHRDILELRSWCRSQTGRSNWIPIGQTGWCRHSNGATGTSRAFLISPRSVGPGSPRRSASRASRSRCRAAARACSLAWRGVIRPGTTNLPPPPRRRPSRWRHLATVAFE